MYKWEEVFTESNKYASLILPNNYECKSYGYITWKDKEYPVYTDDYGCQDFIIFKYKNKEGEVHNYHITVENMAGMVDWDFMLDHMIDTYGDEEN